MFRIDNKYLTPAPFVNFQRQQIFADDGRPLNYVYNVTLQGTLIPHKGSPTSTAWSTTLNDPPAESFVTDDEKFAAILAKQEILKETFSATGYKITYHPTGSEPITFYPKLNSINFSNGNWVTRCDYTIDLEAPTYNLSGSVAELSYGSGYTAYNLVSLSDDYGVRERDDGQSILEITRTVSARASFKTDGADGLEPWERAKAAVYQKLDEVPFDSGIISIGNFSCSGYNFVEEENFSQVGGSYTLNQRFTCSPNNYSHVRRINRQVTQNLLGDGGPTVERINVQGTIEGFSVDNDASGKMSAALAYWYSISGNIGAEVGAYGSGVTTSLDQDFGQGIVNYSIEFVNNSGQYYKHNYDVSSVIAGGDLPVVTIAGTIEGYTPDELYYGAGANYTKFDNAASGWSIVEPGLKTLAFAHPAITETTSSLFGNTPLSKNVSFNKPNGTINYNYSFAYTSGTSTNYQHNYDISIETSNASTDVTEAGLLCTATINGQIVGLQSGDWTTKIANAKTGWNTIRNSVFTLVNNDFSLIGDTTPPLYSGQVRKVISTDSRNGVLSYSLTYNNYPAPSSSLVAVEDVSVEDNPGTRIVAIQNIPGRLSGPIIQDIGTYTENRRSVNIALTMIPQTGSPHYYQYSDISIPAGIASGLLASVLPTGGYYIAGDTANWQWKNGFYTRNVSIIF